MNHFRPVQDHRARLGLTIRGIRGRTVSQAGVDGKPVWSWQKFRFPGHEDGCDSSCDGRSV